MQYPNQGKKCPICREPFNPIQVMPNFGLLNYMAELRRNRSRSPRNLRARGSIGRVIHQPRTPPGPPPATPVPRTPPAEDTPVSDSIPGYQGPSSHLTPEQLEVLEDVPPELIQARASQDSRRLLNESNLTHRIERTLKGNAN